MDLIIKTLQDAIQINLVYVVLMEIVVAGLFIFNIWLGTVLGTRKEGFDWKKFFFGIFKDINILLIIFGVCYILNLFVCVLNLIKDIEINIDIVTTLEIIAILIAWGIDLTKDIVEKIKSIKELKYIKYDDIKFKPQGEVNGSDVIEEEDTGKRLKVKEVG